MNTSDRIHSEIAAWYRKYGEKIKPWYVVLGMKEIEEITLEWRSRPRFGMIGEEYKTPNRFYTMLGDHRIVAIPVESHFSLGFDPEVANYYDKTTPFWEKK